MSQIVTVGPAAVAGQGTVVSLLMAVERARLCFWDEFARREWDRKQRAVLDTIRRRSFDLGRTRAWIPKLSYFVEDNDFGGSRVDKADISRGIDELEAARVICAPAKLLGRNGRLNRPPGWYGINVTFGAWKIEPKRHSAICEQLWLEVQEPDLDEALRETFIEFGGEVPSKMPLGTGAVPSLRLGPLGPGCARDTVQAPVGDSAEAPQVGRAAYRLQEFNAPGGHGSTDTVRGYGGRGSGCWENPNDATPGAGQGGSQVTAARSAGSGALDPGVGKKPIPVQKVLVIPTPGRGAEVVSPRTPLPGGTEETEGTEQLNNRARSQRTTETDLRARAQGSVGKIPTLPRRRVQRAEEERLMELLAAFFAVPTEAQWEFEMKRSADFWRLKVVRNCPDELEEKLAEGRYLDHQHYPFKWKPAWLSRGVAKLVGVRDWEAVPRGPEPVG